MKRVILAGVCCLALAACGGHVPEPKIVTQVVKVAVPVPCKPDLGPEPDYPDTDAKLKTAVPYPGAEAELAARPGDPLLTAQVYANGFERTKLLVAGRLMRIARDAEKSAALAKCAA